MLGRLATWLRILGYDAAYFRGADAELVARARRESRILLTRDSRLPGPRHLPPHLLVRSDRVGSQLAEVMAAFGLDPRRPAAGRCPRCNLPLAPQERAAVAGRVPEYVWSRQEAFWGCQGCGRIFWAGTHRRRIDEVIATLPR
jgi:uncharacterized protein with PIN domain